MDFLGAKTASIQNQYLDIIQEIIAEYRNFNKTDNGLIGAMAFTIGQQRSRIMELEKKVQELSQPPKVHEVDQYYTEDES